MLFRIKQFLISLSCVAVVTTTYSKTSDYKDSVTFLTKKAEKLIKHGELSQSRILYIEIGDILFKNNQYDESIKYYQKSLTNQYIKKDTIQFKAHINLGKSYTKQAKYYDALNNFILALNFAKNSKNKSNEAISWNHIGVIHWKEGKNILALQAYNNSLRIRETLNDTRGIAEIYNNIGIIYKIERKFDKALSYYEKSITLRKKVNDRSGISQTLFNIGSVKSELGLYEEALKYYQESYLIKIEQNNIYGKLPHFLNVGDAYVQLKKYNLAEENYKNGIELAKKLGALDYQMSFYKQLATLNSLTKNFEEAYSFHLLYALKKDSIVNTTSKIKLTELEVKYNTAEKQQRIEQLKLEKQLNKQKIERAVFTRNILISFVVIGLLIFLVVLRNERNLKRTNLLLTKQKEIIEQREREKELLTREMHHRVKNNLQLTSSLLSLQSRQVTDNEGKQALKEAQNRIQAISLIHQKLYAFENISTINLAEYVPELCIAIFQSNCDSTKQITLNHSIDTIFVSIDTAISIGLFANEALINSIKHGFSSKSIGTISISIKEHKNTIELSISDDGKGITILNSIDEFGNFGFQLLRSFATKLSSSIEIKNLNGTTITLNLPLKIKANG